MDLYRAGPIDPEGWANRWVLDDGSDMLQTFASNGDRDGEFARNPVAHADVRDAIAAHYQIDRECVVLSPFQLGGCHPRIARHDYPEPSQLYHREWRGSVQAARNLFAEMRDVFRTIEPVEANDVTHGHRLRELLILACTEVESGWKGVLDAQGYGSGGRDLNRRDYVKLMKPMRLGEWTVHLFSHPGYRPIKPFAGWTPNTTGTLPWYDDYNATKHGREQSFARATLKSMVDAIAAVYVMVRAQFGRFSYQRSGERHPEKEPLDEQDEFRVLASPAWALEEHYPPPTCLERKGRWQPIPRVL